MGLCLWLCLQHAPKFSGGTRFAPAGAEQAAAATSLGCAKDTARPDSQPIPLAPLPCQHPPPASRGSGRTPLPGTCTGFLPQQIEAVNIDSLLFQGFIMPSDTQKLLSAPIITNLQSKCVLMGRRATPAPTNHL